MDRRQFLAGVTAAVTPAVAGGGSGNGGYGGNGGGNDETTTEIQQMTTEGPGMTTEGGGTTTGGMETTSGSDLPSSATVDMKDISFKPPTISVAVGGSVTWENKDSFKHDVTAAQFNDAGDSWSFHETVSGGGSTSHTFDSAGTYQYYCSIHGKDSMCGVVVVGSDSYSGSLPCQSGSSDGGGMGY
ncbi:MAG: plastocyanin/azurin family copper-binding protein [Halapricum sp.]